jgi:hypothetical protein
VASYRHAPEVRFWGGRPASASEGFYLARNPGSWITKQLHACHYLGGEIIWPILGGLAINNPRAEHVIDAEISVREDGGGAVGGRFDYWSHHIWPSTKELFLEIHENIPLASTEGFLAFKVHFPAGCGCTWYPALVWSMRAYPLYSLSNYLQFYSKEYFEIIVIIHVPKIWKQFSQLKSFRPVILGPQHPEITPCPYSSSLWTRFWALASSFTVEVQLRRMVSWTCCPNCMFTRREAWIFLNCYRWSLERYSIDGLRTWHKATRMKLKRSVANMEASLLWWSARNSMINGSFWRPLASTSTLQLNSSKPQFPSKDLKWTHL